MHQFCTIPPYKILVNRAVLCISSVLYHPTKYRSIEQQQYCIILFYKIQVNRAVAVLQNKKYRSIEQYCIILFYKTGQQNNTALCWTVLQDTVGQQSSIQLYAILCTLYSRSMSSIYNYKLQVNIAVVYYRIMMKFNTAANHCSLALQLYAAYLQARCIVGSGGYFLTPTFIIATSHNSKHGRNLYRM